ncbi:MAG: tetratricopeptide repeat protein [Proteobacteria bacterium]|nr:tetratricopeptide repeat protein [Pseudomonadota bacterium]MBU1688812.1 tetratricopeptide repeat protein [Pseudomonadota bacterium]
MIQQKYIHLMALAILAILIALPYSNTLHSPFTFDDEPNITKNTFIQLPDLSFSSFQQTALKSPSKRRWLPNISFALNYYYSGTDVYSYHVVNILLHLLTAFFLYGLLFSTLRLPWSGLEKQRAMEISFLATLLWGANPVNTNAVTYIVQRMTIMAALFYIAALFCYVRGRTGKGSTTQKSLWFAGCLIMGLSAFASKENAFVLPFTIVGYEIYFLRSDLGRHKKIITIAAVGSLIFFALTAWIILGNNIWQGLLAGYGSRDFTLGQRLLTEGRIIFHYLSLLILPLPGRLNFTYDYPLSTGLFSPPQTFFALTGLVALVVAALYLFRKDRLWSFAIFWFLLNLAMESSIIPLELIFEHRLYLPSMFFMVAVLVSLSRITATRTHYFRGTAALLTMLLLFFTWQRNQVWANEITLWEDVARKSPRLARAYVNLGLAYGTAGNNQKEIEYSRKAIALKPDSKEAGEALLNLGVAYQELGRYRESVQAFQQILTLSSRTNLHEAHSNLAFNYIRMNQLDKAIEEARWATKINPAFPDGYLNLGVALGLLGQHRQSEEALRQGISFAPRDARLYMWLAVALEPQRRYQEAVTALNQARALLTPADSNWAKINSFTREIKAKISRTQPKGS